MNRNLRLLVKLSTPRLILLVLTATIMSTKRSSDSDCGGVKVKRKLNTSDTKVDILRRANDSDKAGDVARNTEISKSTVYSTIKKYQQSAQSEECKNPVPDARIKRLNNMEKLLNAWVKHETQKHTPLSMGVIQEKARSIFEDLKQREGEGSEEINFNVIKWCFEWYKRYTDLHGNILTNKAASTDTDALATAIYQQMLKQIIKDNDYTPQQVFNADETGLYWKRMPSKTSISRNENRTRGFRASKDRMSLLLGGNAAGDFKLKPLLVYHTETPSAMKNYFKTNLPVTWHANKKAWVTSSIFKDWFSTYFCPAVEKYCADNNLAHKALLLLDNATRHPITLNDFNPHVRVVFLPKNKISLIQPMDQGIITTFKAYYVRNTFSKLIKYTSGENKPTVNEFWRTFNIMDAISNIDKSWKDLTVATMNIGWKQLWPECVNDFHDFQEALPDICRDIVTLARRAGFDEVDDDDVTELLESHGETLTKEELVQLEDEKSRLGEDEEDDMPESSILTLGNMSKFFNLFEEGLELVRKSDPCKDRSLAFSMAVNNALQCYKTLYVEKQSRAKQPSLDAHFRSISPSTSPNKTVEKKMAETTASKKTPPIAIIQPYRRQPYSRMRYSPTQFHRVSRSRSWSRSISRSRSRSRSINHFQSRSRSISRSRSRSRSISHSRSRSHSSSRSRSQSCNISLFRSQSRSISRSRSRSHSINHSPSQSHSISHSPSQSHSISHSPSRSRSISRSPSRSRSISRSPSQSCSSSHSQSQSRSSSRSPSRSSSISRSPSSSRSICPSRRLSRSITPTRHLSRSISPARRVSHSTSRSRHLSPGISTPIKWSF
ncbi:tigger transposable element-derived protein 1 [Cherax quadricarinatus]|uniref:tigger transposable element-derived protein 1 n=1 Tax=Cherax quadricarinatus TaxID=27406 RepID=UPI002379E678|nr:tigger transposable element-derived protein 1-like [Cherax quadricarinatus]